MNPTPPFRPTFGEAIGALAFLPSVYVIAWLALSGPNDLRNIALGTLSGVVGAGLGFYLRSKLAAGDGVTPPVVPPVAEPQPLRGGASAGPSALPPAGTTKPPAPLSTR